MLRPSQSLLASSRSARRRAFRQDVTRGAGSVVRRLAAASAELVGTIWDVAVLCCAPVVYVAASYLALDLPARWIFGPAHFSWLGFGVFAAAAGLSFLGVSRALRSAPPVAPVRPVFARTMLIVTWGAALVLTIADLSG